MFGNTLILNGHSRESLSISAAAAQTETPLTVGTYAVWSDVDCSIKVDSTPLVGSDVDVTVASGYPITGGSDPVAVRIPNVSKVQAIASVNGTLYYHKIAQ